MQQSLSKRVSSTLSPDQLANIARDVCAYAGRGNLIDTQIAKGNGLIQRLLRPLRRKAPTTKAIR